MKSLLAKNIGRNIKEQLKNQPITQKTLAETLKISPGEMSLVIKGERTLSINSINKISEMFSVSVEDLFLKNIEDKENILLNENTDIGVNIDELSDKDVKFLNSLISSFKEKKSGDDEK